MDLFIAFSILTALRRRPGHQVFIMNHSDNRFAISALMVIASAVLWGLYGSFVTLLTSMGLAQNALVFLRMLATSLPVAFLMLVTDRSAFKVRPADIPLFIANGMLSLLFFVFCYTSAIKVTKIATAAALLYTAPAIVMILSAILFKERLTGRKVFCCLLAVIGCAFASGIGGELFAGGAANGAGGAGSLITPAGLLLGLGAGLGYALYSIFSRIILNRGYSVYTNVCYSFGVAMIGFLALSYPYIRGGPVEERVYLEAPAAVGDLDPDHHADRVYDGLHDGPEGKHLL